MDVLNQLFTKVEHATDRKYTDKERNQYLTIKFTDDVAMRKSLRLPALPLTIIMIGSPRLSSSLMIWSSPSHPARSPPSSPVQPRNVVELLTSMETVLGRKPVFTPTFLQILRRCQTPIDSRTRRITRARLPPPLLLLDQPTLSSPRSTELRSDQDGE
jgi:hypothetical protein